MARRIMWTLENGPGGRTSQLLNHRRVEAQTLLLNEADTRWDGEWTATRAIQAGLSEWKPSLGKTSNEFREAAKSAETRADRNRFEDLARRAAAEEKKHFKNERFLAKARRYSDRSRFRCIGTPLLLQDERQSMSLRSRRSLSTRARGLLFAPTTSAPSQFGRDLPTSQRRAQFPVLQKRPLTVQGENSPHIHN